MVVGPGKAQAVEDQEGFGRFGSRLSRYRYRREEAIAVIKGALILATGFGLGYGKALYDHEAITELAVIVRESFVEAWGELRREQEAKDQNKTPTEFMDMPESAIQDDELENIRDNIHPTEGENI